MLLLFPLCCFGHKKISPKWDKWWIFWSNLDAKINYVFLIFLPKINKIKEHAYRETQANVILLKYILLILLPSRSIVCWSFGSRRQLLQDVSGNHRSPPLVFLQEKDHGQRRNGQGFWIKRTTIFKQCLQNETGTCKFNGPSLFEKLKLCSAVSFPLTCPLVFLRRPPFSVAELKLEDGSEIRNGGTSAFVQRAHTVLRAERNTSDGSLPFFPSWNINFL